MGGGHRVEEGRLMDRGTRPVRSAVLGCGGRGTQRGN